MTTNNYFEVDNPKCIKCLQCLRSCRVNAIGYVNNNVFIHQKRCVSCGKCYEYCSNGAIKIKDCTTKCSEIIEQNEIIVASISPTWVSEFRGVSMHQMIAIIKKLGFTHVSQATLGATVSIEKTKRILEAKSPLVISSICPVVNKLIETYYPQCIKYINPISSPETLHCRMIKKWYGEDAKVIYISSCIASHENKVVDGAITFQELSNWIEEKKIKIETIPKNGCNEFDPYMATDFHGYQLVCSATKYFPENNVQSASGLNRVIHMLEDINIDSIEGSVYLELFACEGGCLTSVGSIDKANVLAKKLRFDKHIKDGKSCHNNKFPKINIYSSLEPRNITQDAQQQQKEDVLRKMNITQSGSLLNCAACGYHTCDDFANAVVLKMAEVNTCVWHQKNAISNNLAKIIEHIPYGFFIINSDMKFINVNEEFCKSVGVDRHILLSKEIDIDKLISFGQEIREMNNNPADNKRYEVLVNSREMKLNLFAYQQNELVVGELKNFLSSDQFSDEYVESVKNIIRDNVSAIQSIAHLLGENMSRTETLLSSITENKE